MSESAHSHVERLIDAFHGQERIRVWSLVITIFGDAVNPRGGELWLGSLQDLMSRLRVEPSALRAAMSRLTSDGWLLRIREGRNSYYRLAEAGQAEFAEATTRIYAPGPVSWDGQWTIILSNGPNDRKREARRSALQSAGFGALSRGLFLRPSDGAETITAQPDEFIFSARLREDSNVGALIEKAWSEVDAQRSYASFAQDFRPLDEALQAKNDLDPLSSIAARTLLIHAFRRAALRDPNLPPELTPDAWKADEARRIASSIYGAIAGPSERWLDECKRSGDRTLARPEIDITRRFRAPSV